MIPRLVTIVIFLFCGTMTVLLVRSVLHPEASRLAAVAPNVPFDLFASRTEGSRLDIWEANRIIGSCELTPVNGGSGLQMRREKVNVRVQIIVRLRQEIMNSSLLELTGSVILHATGNVDNLALKLSLAGSLPPLELAIHQPPGKEWPALVLTRGSNILFKSTTGLQAGGANSAMVEVMLKSAGLSLDTLTGKETGAPNAATVRAGHFEAGGETFDGYFLAGSSGDETSFRLYMSNTGEILRIDTPFTGDNGLGLRLLSASLRPADAGPPDLNKYQLPKSVP